MFIDNTKKIIFISVPGTDSEYIEEFFKEQFQNNSIDVYWGWTNHITFTDYIENVDISPEVVESILSKSKEEQIAFADEMLLKNANKVATIQNIVDSSLLTSPLSDYHVYGFCREPIDRSIILSELTNYTNVKNLLSNNSITKDQLEPTAINTRVLNSLNYNFILNEGDFHSSRINKLGYAHKPQNFWVKHNDLAINKLFSYTNYMNLIAEICNRYDINPSLYDDRKRHGSRKSNINVENLSDEMKTKILEHYAEDKTLYDSLPGVFSSNTVSSMW